MVTEVDAGEESIEATEPFESWADAGPGFEAISEYDQKCPVENDDQSLECDWLHALVVAEVVDALEGIERARDRRGVQVALEAVDLLEEPEILVAACRVLGQFADSPGIAGKLTPLLLDSPYIEVQSMAANVLARNPDQNLAGLAQQWLTHHGSSNSSDPFKLMPEVPTHYPDMGFTEYPGLQRFTPVDSDRSVGWWTPDEPGQVVAAIRSALNVAPLNYQQWIERGQQQLMNAMASIDQSKIKEAERLMEKYLANPDPALMERIQLLQSEAYAPMQELQEGSDNVLTNVVSPPTGAGMDSLYYFIAEERPGRVSRVILVYQQPGMGRTVLQMAWDLRDYPAAWGTEL